MVKYETDRVVVRRSGIHGRGMFAKRNIKEGETIIEYVGDLITHAEADRRGNATYLKADNMNGAVYLFTLNKKYVIDGDVDYNIAKYVNHSCEPNCEAVNILNHIYFVAKREILKCEELFFDYAYEYTENYNDHPCKCGASKCVGYIVNDEGRKKILNRQQTKVAYAIG